MIWENLITKCIEMIKSYNPISHSPDTHFQNHYKPTHDPNEKTFIQQVFYGVNRYRDLLKRLNKSLFKLNPTSTNSTDSIPFMIISYLTIFRYEELGQKYYKKILDTQDALKMHILLSLLLNASKLDEHVKSSWCEIYDSQFIENLIEQNDLKSQDLSEFLDCLSTKATGHGTLETSAPAAKEKSFTVAQPFILSKGNTKPLLKSTEPEVKIEFCPIPEVIYKFTLSKLAARNRRRRSMITERVISQYDHAHDPIRRLFN